MSNGRWADWDPKEQNSKTHPSIAATKPSKHGFVGFEGPIRLLFAKIGADPSSQILGENQPTKPTKSVGTDAERGIPYAAWLADRLNALFRHHGTAGEPSRITAVTVADGLSHKKKTTNYCSRLKGDHDHELLPRSR
jgi:hypothetical protein